MKTLLKFFGKVSLKRQMLLFSIGIAACIAIVAAITLPLFQNERAQKRVAHQGHLYSSIVENFGGDAFEIYNSAELERIAEGLLEVDDRITSIAYNSIDGTFLLTGSPLKPGFQKIYRTSHDITSTSVANSGQLVISWDMSSVYAPMLVQGLSAALMVMGVAVAALCVLCWFMQSRFVAPIEDLADGQIVAPTVLSQKDESHEDLQESVLVGFTCPEFMAISRGLSGSVVSTYTDEEREQLVADLTAARGEAEAAEEIAKQKMAFLSQMSHEIRTPLNAILGFGRLLRGKDLEQEDADFVDQINASGELLLAIVNDILDLSKIEAGGIQMENLTFDLAETIDTTITMIGSTVDSDHVSLVIEDYAKLDHQLVGDPHRIKQVLINMVGNAIKFTEKGSVTVRTSLVDDSDTPNAQPGFTTVRFEVEDTGIGMTEQQLGKIFQPFTQADSFVTRKYGGTGLGLTISRQLVEVMGGELQATSEVDAGSTFFFELPFALTEEASASALKARAKAAETQKAATEQEKAAPEIKTVATPAAVSKQPKEEPAPAPAPTDQQEETPKAELVPADQATAPQDEDEAEEVKVSKILVAEDEAVNRLLVTKIFATLDQDVEFAEDGLDCVNRLSVEAFDTIFLDLHMPHFNGLEIAKRIKSGEFGLAVQNARLAMMSADVLADEESKKIGIDAFITKPIDIGELKSFLNGEWKRVDDEEEEKKEMSVLVVEDQALNRRLIGQLFSTFGVQPDFAKDGVECIEYLENNPRPDVIFLDLRMPRMDGWTCARKIRGGEVGEQVADIPIAVVSAEVGSEEICKEIGVDEFIPKPFDATRIRKFVDNVGEEHGIALSR